MKKKLSVNDMIDAFMLMNDEQIEKEVADISDIVFALLTATDNQSIEVMYDRTQQVTMSLTDINSTLN